MSILGVENTNPNVIPNDGPAMLAWLSYILVISAMLVALNYMVIIIPYYYQLNRRTWRYYLYIPAMILLIVLYGVLAYLAANSGAPMIWINLPFTIAPLGIIGILSSRIRYDRFGITNLIDYRPFNAIDRPDIERPNIERPDVEQTQLLVNEELH
jgi:hypothetical protein